MKAIPAWEQFEVVFNSNAYDENSLEQFAVIIIMQVLVLFGL